MSILAVSSQVSVGYVGNAAAVPAFERLGHEVWRVDTVAFSNHPGHHRFTGKVRPDHEIAELLRGVGEHTGWGGLQGVYSGYLGEADTGRVLAKTLDTIRCAAPDAIYACDPVIGDHGRVFVREGVENAIREELVPRAQIITPNAFELARLSGHRVETVGDAHAAAVTLLEWGPAVVIGTGIPDGDHLAIVAVTADTNLIARSPWRDRPFFGTGDLFTALFLAHYLPASDPAAALAKAVAGLEVATAATEAAGTKDLALIANLDAIVGAKPAAVDRLS
ncbi:MAG: pyridoxal kinase [Alphaproteobacteria bacterium]|nr:pyridoxal kinase [Alphaproteobacteria bacterium]